jgi:hypothetical protein
MTFFLVRHQNSGFLTVKGGRFRGLLRGYIGYLMDIEKA